MVWYTQIFGKYILLEDSLFDITEGDDIEEKHLIIYRVNTRIQRRCSCIMDK